MRELTVLLIALTTFWTLAGLAAVLIVTRKKRTGEPRDGEPLSPISVLKPLRGADDDLAENLESFFRQDHPSFELIFGVTDHRDRAVPVVQRLIAAHPEVRATLVIHPGRPAGNPKVSNLLGMLPAAHHDLVLISDSNVRAPQGYLRDLAETIDGDPGVHNFAGFARCALRLLSFRGLAEGCAAHTRPAPVGLVTNLFAGTGERSLGAALENAQLNGFIAAGAAAPMVMGDAVVVGKSMLMRRSVLDRLGGLESVADVLAEDYVIGKMFQHGGYQIRLSSVVLENINRDTSVSAFFSRHLRWSMLRVRLHPVAFVLEALTNPLAMLPLAIVAFGVAPALIWAGALILLRDSCQWMRLRGPRRALLPLLIAPLRELCMLGVWLATPWIKTVSWRGHKVRLGAGTRIYLPDFMRSPNPDAHQPSGTWMPNVASGSRTAPAIDSNASSL